ncbi:MULTISPECIES: hypothetical protein [unclassified Coleofasciculus]|uniref:hypothetical protein n=1 Tax=unclassified Coleofasciculus TaxID=2692782 RepID=UPI00187EDD92|nr:MULTISPECIES: hypothetical protein [unclassified Coleofasciculus]MBE9125064.1 hypothetical protein [Coleofasciculus sp. LEGE 07081]MBE9151290.1 hypothetical protein [Coleofasciculus sp. LEGE 07092]
MQEVIVSKISSEIRSDQSTPTFQTYSTIATSPQSSIQVSRADISAWVGWIILLILVGLPIVIILQYISSSGSKRDRSRRRRQSWNSDSSSGSSSWDSESSSDLCKFYIRSFTRKLKP